MKNLAAFVVLLDLTLLCKLLNKPVWELVQSAVQTVQKSTFKRVEIDLVHFAKRKHLR